MVDDDEKERRGGVVSAMKKRRSEQAGGRGAGTSFMPGRGPSCQLSAGLVAFFFCSGGEAQ